ncbi:MAG: M56 family metallopeptidase [Holophaga sp.]|nr:M56 family metallopeptidase [Holophaga sp.]
MTPFLVNPLLSRLGLTVFHALWQLVVLGLLAWVGLVLLRRYASTTRYGFACAVLSMMVIAPVVTFFLIQPATIVSPTQVLQIEVGGLTAAPVLGTEGLRGLFLRIRDVAPWMAILWSLGALVMLARLTGGIWWLDRTYRAQSRPVAEPWQAALNQVALRMGLTRGVRLLQSANVDTPLVIGWLRPVILISTSALLNLSPMALEAVLAHELAHIRRLDYLANLLQCLAEALLFFHPAAWWLSRQIRELREHCCDDAAAELCGDPMILAEGLSALERMRRSLHSDPEPALAAAKGNLMSRITRLFQPQDVPTSSLRDLAWTLVGASLLGAAALSAQQVSQKPAPTATSKPAASQLRIILQPAPPPYPAAAREKNIQGAVVLRLHIQPDGTPNTVEMVQGPEEFRASAMAYAKGWRFQPRTGEATEATFRLNLIFAIKGSTGAEDIISQIPKSNGPSATVEILTVATPEPDKSGLLTYADLDFSQIKIALQPPPPAYPPDAKIAKIQGTVVVSITIDEKGVPEDVQALEGPEELRDTAVDYAREWLFEPAQQNGKPVKARFKLSMPFKLR